MGAVDTTRPGVLQLELVDDVLVPFVAPR